MRVIIRQPACPCCNAWRSQVDAVQDHPDPKRVLELLTAAVACKASTSEVSSGDTLPPSGARGETSQPAMKGCEQACAHGQPCSCEIEGGRNQ